MNLPNIPQTFHLGSLLLHTYGVTFALAVCAAYVIGRYAAAKRGIKLELYDDIAFWALIIGFISARAYYVIFYPQFFRGDFWEIFRTWDGGISIYGGLIGGVAAVFWRTHRYKLNIWNVLDSFALGLPMAQAIGRIGNYINHEAFGQPTNSAWKIFIPLIDRPVGYYQYQYFQPTFLYEMICDLAIFGILIFIFYLLTKKNKTNPENIIKHSGIIFASYLILYSITRFFIEHLRLDSAFIFGLKVDQITAVLLFIVGLGILYSRYHYETFNS
jgi:phosphatidylglycerol:prolipoprotein diacylglycerol transferase